MNQRSAGARETARRFAASQSSALNRVVAIGKAASTPGVSVELLALEIRALSAVLHWRAYVEQESRIATPEFEVQDDLGNIYSATDWQASRNGHEIRGLALIDPVPPDTAQRLRVTVIALASAIMPRSLRLGTPDRVEGPWSFEFPVGQ
jgi:hypothetical protein